MPRPKRWIDIDDVIAWYVQLLEEADLEGERQHAMLWDGSDLSAGPTWGHLSGLAEDRAVQWATRGNFRPVARLLRTGRHLGKRARDLIADRLEGTYKASRRGNPGRLTEQRLEASPVHAAAREFPHIEEMLRRDYPAPTGKDIRDRAILIATVRWRLEPSTLANYLNRSRQDRRRLDHK
jgi:hypothetical protein